jgi:CHAT domain-containing protein
VKLALGDRQVEVFEEDPVDKQRLCRVVRVADILHLIVHGTFDDASPYRSGVYLKGPQQKDRLWTIADIFGDLDAPPGRLAVLSGCETGLSRPNLVSEEISLPAALIAAGFAAVIATKWLVDDLSTALLMGEFYRCWYAGGLTACRALSDSTQWLRRLRRADAIALLESSERGLAEGSPGSEATAWRTMVGKAVRTVRSGPERPFEAAYYWAPFFVAGDGSITADGVDSREPASAGSRNGH